MATKKPDPIFALIKVHAAAVTAETRATLKLLRLKDRLDKRKDQARRHAGRRLTCSVPFFDIGPKYDPVIVAKSREDLKREIFRAFDKLRMALGPRGRRAVMQQEKEAIREMQRRYDAFQRAHRRQRKAVGLTAAEEADDAAHRAATEALQRLLALQPTSPEGRRALAKHLASLGPSSGPWWALRNGLERLAQ